MDKEFYINLITKHLSGEISEKEQKELNKWHLHGNENNALFERMQTAWKQAEKYKTEFNPNIKNAWNKIESKTSKTKVVLFTNWYISAAASVLLLLGLSWLAFHNKTITVNTQALEQKEIFLPDGTMVSLNENSQLSYSKKFKTRSVSLNGEAFFDVVHNAQKPFAVSAGKTSTLVLGTSFNIKYIENNKIDVSLVSGKIAFESPENEKLILSPGEQILYSLETNTISKSEFENQNFIAWKTSILEYDNTELEKVISDVNLLYKSGITLKQNGNNCRFTGTFENSSTKEIIEVLSFTYNMDYDDNKILSIKTCN